MFPAWFCPPCPCPTLKTPEDPYLTGMDSQFDLDGDLPEEDVRAEGLDEVLRAARHLRGVRGGLVRDAARQHERVGHDQLELVHLVPRHHVIQDAAKGRPCLSVCTAHFCAGCFQNGCALLTLMDFTLSSLLLQDGTSTPTMKGKFWVRTAKGA